MCPGPKGSMEERVWQWSCVSSREQHSFKQRAGPWLSEHTVRALKWQRGRGWGRGKNKTLGSESRIRVGTDDDRRVGAVLG